MPIWRRLSERSPAQGWLRVTRGSTGTKGASRLQSLFLRSAPACLAKFAFAFAHDAYHVVFYVAKFEEVVYVLHAFQKKTSKRRPSTTSRLAGSVTESGPIKNAKRAWNKVQIPGAAITCGVYSRTPGDLMQRKQRILKIRADLMLDFAAVYIREQVWWTQTQAAAFFDETQPRISNSAEGRNQPFQHR